MEFNPKVSIVIPVYNGSNYMREAIDSALAQTYRNIEVIVVNDGSDDGGKTEEIAKSYGDKIRYFCKENGGVASALNLGIREMTGEWFAWLSHDDKFSENRIEEDINIVRREPDTKVTFCNTAIIDAEGDLVEKKERIIQKVSNPREVFMLMGVGMCTITINKSCFETVGLFNEANKITQDVEMTLNLSKNFTFHLNNKAVSYSREHPQRGTHRLKEQRRKDCLLLCRFIEQNFTVEDFFPELDKSDKILNSNALLWLGDLHRGFGAYDIANKYYKAAFYERKRLVSVAGINYILGARRLDGSFFRTLAKLKVLVCSKLIMKKS